MRFALCICAALAAAPVARAQDPKGGAHPRRLLVVQLADYVYLNPLTHGAPAGTDRTRDAAARLALGLRVPAARDNDQLFVLSDRLAADAPLPTRAVLAKVIDGFCSTTRAQDRVVVYFGAHAVEKDGKAFLVPIDGDPAAPATLLPVADVYKALGDLKAAQKVVIWDVCRRNPDRARGRTDPGPMTEALFKALTAAPDGVQVIVSCSPGERASESFPRVATVPLTGSAYFDALAQAATDHRTANPKVAPGEPIPVEALHKAVTGALKGQKPALAGAAPRDPAAFDAKEQPAKRFAPPAAPKPLTDVKAVFDELALPFAEGDRAPLARLAFTEEALKGYAADVSAEEVLKNADKYPLRAATLRALATARNAWRLDGKEHKAVAALNAPIGNLTKRSVSTAQELVALAIIELEVELERLDAVADKRGAEPKRWQAHYDYTLAEVRLRLVMLNEYNRALAHVRTESLPDLPPGSPGWRLTPTDRLEGKKDAKLMLAQAHEGFTQLATTHKGTPWEVLARRALATHPGARWEPIPVLK